MIQLIFSVTNIKVNLNGSCTANLDCARLSRAAKFLSCEDSTRKGVTYQAKKLWT